jgi:hypothetical protein
LGGVERGRGMRDRLLRYGLVRSDGRLFSSAFGEWIEENEGTVKSGNLVSSSIQQSNQREHARLSRDLEAIEDRLDVMQDPVEEVRLQERKKLILQKMEDLS